MPSLRPSQALVAPHVVLDGRLALFHRKQRWLAVADLHFGFEISQRAAGRLMPMWGMATVEQRLRELIDDYKPRRLVVVGDIVHDRTAASQAAALFGRLADLCEPIILAGNHDRLLERSLPLRESWKPAGFHFHHGHCANEPGKRIQIIGHHHPAATIRDGAGLRLKLPAFVQENGCWILPAFSPWAAGGKWEGGAQSRMWLCTPQRILRLPAAETG